MKVIGRVAAKTQLGKEIRVFMGLSMIVFFLLLQVSLYSLSMFNVVSMGHNYTDIEFDLSGWEFLDVVVDGVKYQRLYHPNSGYIMEEGFPELLSFSL